MAGKLKQMSDRMVNIAVLIVGLLGLCLCSHFLFKFIGLAMVVGGLLGNGDRGRISKETVWLALALAFSGAFLLTPMGFYLSLMPDGSVTNWPVMGVTAAFVILGGAWLALSLPRRDLHLVASLGALRGRQWRFALVLVLICVVYYGAWGADIAYLGDEGFHYATFYHYALSLFAKGGGFGYLLCLCLVVATTIPLLRGKARMYAALGGCVIFLLGAAVLPMIGNTDWLSEPFVLNRAGRYPTAQPWLSALLAFLANAASMNSPLVELELGRFLPMLSVLFLGVYLCFDPRLHRFPGLIACLAALAMLTVPGFYLYGNVLYLEQFGVACLVVMCFEGKHLLLSPARLIRQRPGWVAALLLCFSKETFFPVVLALVAARAAVQLMQWRSDKNGWLVSLKRNIWEEIGVVLSLLIPVAAYLFVRKLLGEARPYPANLSHMFSPSLYWQLIKALVRQNGALVLVAIAGVVALVQRRKWWLLALPCYLFAVLFLFLLGDTGKYVGLTRFCLLLYPPIVFLSWQFLIVLGQRSRFLFGIVLLLLFASNVLLSPIDLRGQRTQIDPEEMTGECWYPYTECFVSIGEISSNPGIIIFGNTAEFYPFRLVTDKVFECPPKVMRVEAQQGLSLAKDLGRLLKGVPGEVEFVVYQWNGVARDWPPATAGFRLEKCLKAGTNRLLLYRRDKRRE